MEKKKKIKDPKSANGPHIKTHSSLSSGSTENKKPIFSFRSLDKDYCITHCTTDEKAALLDKLKMLSSMTWMQIKNIPRHGLGCEKIQRNAIKRPPPSDIKDDATFLAFRFCGKASMVGYRESDIFHIIWVDRDFTLYNH